MTDRSPQLLIATLPTKHLEEGLIGTSLRLDVEEPEIWSVGFLEGEARLPYMVNALLVLLLDYQSEVLPRILLPYHPPYALLTHDGRILDFNGVELRSDWLAMLRSMKAEFVPRYKEFFQTAMECSKGRGNCRLLQPGDRFYERAVAIREGPDVPTSLLNELVARRG